MQDPVRPAGPERAAAATARRLIADTVALLAGAVGLAAGAVGLVVAPVHLMWSVPLGVIVGVGVHTAGVDRAGNGHTAVLRDRGVLTGLATVAGCLALTGLVYVLGPATGPVLLAVVVAGGPWVWRAVRRRTAVSRSTGTPTVVTRTALPGGGGRGTGPSRPALVTTFTVAEMSVPELCLAWRRSYLALTETPPGAVRDEIVSLRRELLDELDRRDHDGLVRWLDTGARAAGDPGPYLDAGR